MKKLVKQELNEILKKYKLRSVKKINWNRISHNQKLSEDFIREFQDKFDWNLISSYQKLSEDFIREFKNKVSWYHISKYQKLSVRFILEFKEKLDFENLMKRNSITQEDINKILKPVGRFELIDI